MLSRDNNFLSSPFHIGKCCVYMAQSVLNYAKTLELEYISGASSQLEPGILHRTLLHAAPSSMQASPPASATSAPQTSCAKHLTSSTFSKSRAIESATHELSFIHFDDSTQFAPSSKDEKLMLIAAYSGLNNLSISCPFPVSLSTNSVTNCRVGIMRLTTV